MTDQKKTPPKPTSKKSGSKKAAAKKSTQATKVTTAPQIEQISGVQPANDPAPIADEPAIVEPGVVEAAAVPDPAIVGVGVPPVVSSAARPRNRARRIKFSLLVVALVAIIVLLILGLTSSKTIEVKTSTATARKITTSCYTMTVPSGFASQGVSGCSAQLNIINGTTSSAISVLPSSQASSFPLSEASARIKAGLTSAGAAINDYHSKPISVDGSNAVEASFTLASQPEQAIVYIPDLPATYVQKGVTVGSFLIEGPYYNAQFQKIFNQTISSIRWAK